MSITTSRLPRTDQEHQAFFDNLADGYYEADIQGNLLAANTSLARLLGCEHPAELIGRGYSRFIDSSQVQVLVQAAQRIKRTGEAAPLLTCPVTRADGEQRLFEVSVALVRNEAGKPVNFQGIVRDITESTRDAASVRQLNALQAELEALRKRYDEVSELEQLKTHMIRMTAHDLRSPLSIIGSYIELIEEDLAPHYGEMDGMYVNAIRQAVERIMQLTTDILTLERLNQYRDVTLMRVQLGTVLERTVNEFAENSRQRNQTVTLNFEPLAVYGDSVDLHEAIANLLGNAIKYTPNGGKIEACLRRDGDFAVLEIIDNGYGVPENQQEHLFQPFQRIKTAETHMIEGTGLGLYLVKKIVEKHGGSMIFESIYGEGSTFGFRMPLAKLVE
jgi:PAS domain S-box-containing protein